MRTHKSSRSTPAKRLLSCAKHYKSAIVEILNDEKKYKKRAFCNWVELGSNSGSVTLSKLLSLFKVCRLIDFRAYEVLHKH